jgi:hypothetical protein
VRLRSERGEPRTGNLCGAVPAYLRDAEERASTSREDKQQVIEALMQVNSKYAKPFEKGKMARTSLMGGNWEPYAQIVLGMVSADTLLEIDAQLERLNQNIEHLIESLTARTGGS